jgi:hypothetical protein
MDTRHIDHHAVPEAPILRGILGFRSLHFKFDGYDMVQGSIWDRVTKNYRQQTKYDVAEGELGTFSLTSSIITLVSL